MNDEEVEKKIVDKGLTAARVTPDQIDELMKDVVYYAHHIPDTTTVVAVAFDANGFSLANELSACASPENFDFEIGEKIALEKAKYAAKDKLWELEGYVLKKALCQ